jgi:hypothetical protein
MSLGSPPPRPTPRKRRRPRLAAGEVRARMFKAAKAMIRERGVAISLEEIVMDDVVRDAGVARSSAYRLWPYKGDFVNDLLLNFAGPDWMGTAGFDLDTMLIATSVALEHWDSLDTEDDRRAVIGEAVRQAVGHNTKGLAESVDWEVYAALMATGRGNSNDETRQQLAAELERAEMAFISDMTTFYSVMCSALGLRLRSDVSVTYEHLALAGAAAIEGLALRKKLVDANANNARRMDSDGSLAALVNEPVVGPAVKGGTTDWTLAAWAFLGVLYAITELDPDWEPTIERRAMIEEIQRQTREDIASSATSRT